MIYRKATVDDAEDIAKLHTSSWQTAYKGMFSDDFLANHALNDRRQVWQTRLEHPALGQVVWVAEEDGELLGFVCLFMDHDDQHGALLDNLHISPDQKRRGIGRQLMLRAIDCLKEHDDRSGMYLWVFSENVSAIQFYEKLGGQVAGTTLYDGIGDRPVPAVRMVWRSGFDGPSHTWPKRNNRFT
ncbi:MAG: GNAT family N-acetyltransferase [Planctomycetota bacterium]